MKTQGLMTQGINLVGGLTGSNNTKGNRTGSDFNLMIDQNLKSLQPSISSNHLSAKKANVQKMDKRSDDGKETVANTLSGKNDQSKSIGSMSVNRSDSSDATDYSVNQKQSDVTEQLDADPVDKDELLAQIMAMLSSVQEMVMQQLNLTAEELDQLLSEQGMSISDLLQPDLLQQLVLVRNGQMDISAVLTDENLAASMNDLLNSVEEIKADSNIGLTDQELQQILMKASVEEESVNSLLESGLQEQLSQSANLNGQADIIAEFDDENLTSKDISQKVNSLGSNDQAVTATSTTAQGNEGLDNTSEDASRDEQNELKAADQFQAFIDNLVKTTENRQVDFNGNLSQATELRDIANQILDRIKLSVSSNQASMEMQLNPEHLGKVNLTIQSQNGIMTAQFVVQNELSKEAIESQLHLLRETLNDQGVKVEAIEVTVSAYAFDQNTNPGASDQQETETSNSGKKITLEEALAMSEDIDDSSMISGEAMGISGSQIDYTA